MNENTQKKVIPVHIIFSAYTKAYENPKANGINIVLFGDSISGGVIRLPIKPKYIPKVLKILLIMKKPAWIFMYWFANKTTKTPPVVWSGCITSPDENFKQGIESVFEQYKIKNLKY
jgi:hypothetical protein